MTAANARVISRLADRAFPALLRVFAVLLAAAYALAALRLVAMLGGIAP